MSRSAGGEADTDGLLTILLTLKDRPAFTQRWMDYANSVAFPFKVLIADGSENESAQDLLRDHSRFPGVEYEYVRYPYDAGYSDYYAKMAAALGRVDTPFVAMADNDDFFIVDCARESIRFLAENPEYVSCGGQGAVFWVNPAHGGDAGRLYGENVEWKCTRETESVDAATAMERIRTVSVSKSDTFYYDVKRTNEARRELEIVRQLDLKDLFLVEHLIWHIAAIAGKTKRLEHLYLARQQDSPGSSGGTHQELFGDWFGRMLVDSWSGDFAKFLAVVSDLLACADGITLAQARKSVLQCYRASVAPTLLSNLLEEPTVTRTMPGVVSAVRKLVSLPEGSALKRIARKAYRRLPWISLDIVYGTELISTPVPDAKRDFAPISDFLKTPR